MVREYIAVCQQECYDDAQIIDVLAEIFTREELDSQGSGGEIGFFNIDIDIFRSVIDINVLGTVICSRVFGRQMAENGGGAILNFAYEQLSPAQLPPRLCA